MEYKKILVLAPHTDDGELGCGGAIAKYCEKGREVFYAAFSTCENSVQPNHKPDILSDEVKAATKILGIKKSNLMLYDFQVRHFKRFRQEILEEMIKLKNLINPDLVFLPSPNDIHQDHQVISEEGLRAFKQGTIFGYEMPWNNVSFNTQGFIKLEENHIAIKIEALKEYKSQNYRSYLNEEFIKGLALTRGVQIGVKYAEAFEVIRFVV